MPNGFKQIGVRYHSLWHWDRHSVWDWDITDSITLLYQSNKIVLGIFCTWLCILDSTFHYHWQSFPLLMENIFLGYKYLGLLVKTFLIFLRLTILRPSMIMWKWCWSLKGEFPQLNTLFERSDKIIFNRNFVKVNEKHFMKKADLQFYSVPLKRMYQHLICFYLSILNLEFKCHGTLFKLITIIRGS